MATYNYNSRMNKRMHGPSALQLRKNKPTDSVQQMLDMYDMGGSKQAPTSTPSFGSRRASSKRARPGSSPQRTMQSNTLTSGAYGQQNQQRANQKRQQDRVELAKQNKLARENAPVVTEAEREKTRQKNSERRERRRQKRHERRQQGIQRRQQIRMKAQERAERRRLRTRGPVKDPYDFSDIPFGPGHPLFDPSRDDEMDLSRSKRGGGGQQFSGGKPGGSGEDGGEFIDDLDVLNPIPDPTSPNEGGGGYPYYPPTGYNDTRTYDDHVRAYPSDGGAEIRRRMEEDKQELAERRGINSEKQKVRDEAKRVRYERSKYRRKNSETVRKMNRRLTSKYRNKYGYGHFRGDKLGPDTIELTGYHQDGDLKGLPIYSSTPYEITEDNFDEHLGTGRYLKPGSGQERMHRGIYNLRRDRQARAEAFEKARGGGGMVEPPPEEGMGGPAPMSPMDNFYAMMMGGGERQAPAGGQSSYESRYDRMRRRGSEGGRRGRYRSRF